MLRNFQQYFRIVLRKIQNFLNQKNLIRTLIYKIYDQIWIINYYIKFKILKQNLVLKSIIFVNPEKIKYFWDTKDKNVRFFLKFVRPFLNPFKNDEPYILDGDWDLKENLKLFENHRKYISLYRHFVENVDWEDTKYYIEEYEKYYKGKLRKIYNTIDELNARFKYLDHIYKKIKKEGYKTQVELMQSEGISVNHGRGSNIRKLNDEISVAIGRDGEIIFIDGTHRLAIAKILKLKKIPVKIIIKHAKFSGFK